MIKIWQKSKFIVIGVVALVSIFFSNKSISVVYGAVNVVGGLIYSPEGYFMADNSVFGGPGGDSYSSGLGGEDNSYGPTDLHQEPGCGNCRGGYWDKWRYGTRYNKCCDNKGCWNCGPPIPIYIYDWICTSRSSGNQGKYTEDSACKAAYGANVRSNVPHFNYYTKINICDFNSKKAYRVECVVDISPPDILPPPLAPACAKWRDGDPASGICEAVATSPWGDISTDPAGFIVRITTIILSFTGGIALLLIISAGYKIMTSKGKPEGIQQGKDQLIAAIVGLMFIIFSFVIFQLVFADILKIPGITK